MLNLTSLTAKIGDKEILTDINLTVDAGQCKLIIGPNGSGKSTLLHAIMGKPDIEVQGEIVFDGNIINNLKCHERARLGIFLAHQAPPNIDGVNTMTMLYEVVKARNLAIEKSDLIKQARSVIGSYGLPADWDKRQFNNGASGGERKKNELVQVRLFGSRVLLLDEPDSGLEQKSRQRVIDLIEDVCAVDGCVLLVTHDQELQERYKDNVLELDNGKSVI